MNLQDLKATFLGRHAASLDDSARDFVTRFAAHIEAEVGPALKTAEDMLAQVETRIADAVAAARVEWESIAKAQASQPTESAPSPEQAPGPAASADEPKAPT